MITNIPALTSHRTVLALGTRQAQSSERLSTGKRINRGADDAAGLAVSEKMRNQIRGLDQATRNSQDGISLIQTAEGALEEIHRILERVRVLANQAANDTYTANDRKSILLEVDQILDEIDQIVKNTEFNTIKLLGGSRSIEIGDSAEFTQEEIDEAYQYFLDNIDARTAFFDDHSWAGQVIARAIREAGQVEMISPTRALFQLNPDRNLQIIKENLATRVINTIPGATFAEGLEDDVFLNMILPFFNTYVDETEYNWWMTPMERAEDFLFGNTVSGGAAFSGMASLLIATLQSVDWFEFDPSLLTRDTPAFTHTIPLHLQIQSGANSNQRTDITIRDMSLNSLGLTSFTDDFLQYTLHIGEKEVAQDADGNWYTVWSTIGDGGRGLSNLLNTLDNAINKVSEQRAELGAVQNRLEHTINNILNAHENISASNSRIRDADMAKEMLQLTQANILQQAGISMLSQAFSQQSSIVMQLLL